MKRLAITDGDKLQFNCFIVISAEFA